MKTFYIFVLVTFSTTLFTFAAKLSDEDTVTIKAEILNMIALFEKGDSQALIDRTHRAIYKLVGSKEVYESALKEAADQIMRLDLEFIETTLGEPSKLHSAGEFELCFIPKVSIVRFGDKVVKSTGFMIAVRDKGKTTWKYLDGSGLRKNPQNLHIMFPELPKDIKLPPNKNEIVSG